MSLYTIPLAAAAAFAFAAPAVAVAAVLRVLLFCPFACGCRPGNVGASAIQFGSCKIATA